MTACNMLDHFGLARTKCFESEVAFEEIVLSVNGFVTLLIVGVLSEAVILCLGMVFVLELNPFFKF